MTIKNYMVKPVHITAIKLTRKNLKDVFDFVGFPEGERYLYRMDKPVSGIPSACFPRFGFSEFSQGYVNLGDYVTKDKHGKILVYTADDFKNIFTHSD